MIHDLHRQGLSVSAIARKTGLDRKTVRKHLAEGIKPPTYKPRPERPRQLAAFEPYLLERITLYPDLSGKRLLREIRAMGYSGGYSAVTDYLRANGLPASSHSNAGSRPLPAGRPRSILPSSASSSPTSLEP